MCKYFSLNHFCKFGELCCYKHITSKNNSETVNFEIKIGELETCIKNMSAQISYLEKNIEALQEMSAPKVDFNCEECGYLASSETVLKRHMTIKHLSTNQPENLRDSVQDKSLQLSPGSEARREDLFMLEGEVSLQEVKCEYWTCKYVSNSKMI